MSKKDRYYDEAEILYVQEQHTIDSIAVKLGLAEKTIRLWKKYGDWDLKRKIFLKDKSSAHEELFQVIRNLITSVKEDLANGQKVEAARMYAMTKLIPLITKIKEYEDKTAAKEVAGNERKTLTVDELRQIEQMLGIRINEDDETQEIEEFEDLDNEEAKQ